MKTINELCKEIAQLTDDNDHTGAKKVLARYYDLKKFVFIFNSIEAIHTIEGSMPSEISGYRRRKGIELIAAVAQIDPENIEQIKNAF